MSKQSEIEKDHPDQAIDTALPDDYVDEDAFAAMAAEYAGDPEFDDEGNPILNDEGVPSDDQ